jgi:hypothetical protein
LYTTAEQAWPSRVHHDRLLSHNGNVGARWPTWRIKDDK